MSENPAKRDEDLKQSEEEILGSLESEKLKQYKKLQDILRHIDNVQKSCRLLADRLIDREEFDLARILIANSMLHDNSKLYGVEWEYLSPGVDDKDKLKLAHKQHVATNKHHPEFWGSAKDMPRVYIAEMVCDLNARSMEFGTDLRQYIKDVFLPRHDITVNTKIYKTMKYFIDLLLDEPFKEIKS